MKLLGKCMRYLWPLSAANGGDFPKPAGGKSMWLTRRAISRATQAEPRQQQREKPSRTRFRHTAEYVRERSARSTGVFPDAEVGEVDDPVAVQVGRRFDRVRW